MTLMGRTRTSDDAEVRAALQPLVELAAETGIAVVCVMHLRKQAANDVTDRVGGSIAFKNLARSLLMVVAQEPKDDEPITSVHRYVCLEKNNLTAPQPAVEFQIDGNGVLVWGDTDAKVRAADVLQPAANAERRAPKTAAAKKLLLELLSDNEPHRNKELIEALKAADIQYDTYKKARWELIETHKIVQRSGQRTQLAAEESDF